MRSIRYVESHEVEVLHDDGRWLPGRVLHAYRTNRGSWRAVVVYTAGVGMQYYRGLDAQRIRPRRLPDRALHEASSATSDGNRKTGRDGVRVAEEAE